MASGGTSPVTTAPAPIMARWPTVIPGRRLIAPRSFLTNVGRMAEVTPAARIRIVGQGRIGADENIVFDGDSVPELHAALDGRTVADPHLVFDERVMANITVRADDSA